MTKIKFILVSLLTLFLASAMMAQIIGPPDPPGEHGGDGDVPGGSAPVGSGIFILLGLGATYGGKKVFEMAKMDMDQQ